MTNYRAQKVATEIMREVQDILKRRIRDPRVQGMTITSVTMTGDLSQASVYYSILSDLASDASRTQTGLEKATGLIKRELGSRLKIYKIPELVFIRDFSIQYGDKIDQMLKNLHKEE